MSPTICYIHGLNQTHLSFVYMAPSVGGDLTYVDYSSHQPLEASVKEVSRRLPKDRELVLVGHSLGGVIAVLIALAGTHRVQRVVTVSSPLGGSKAAMFARWVITSVPVFGDITPTSPHVKLIKTRAAPCPVLSIVSTAGSLLSTEPNDGIVTVASQSVLPYAKKVEVKANHFEVLMHERTFEAVRRFVHQEVNG